MNSGLRRTRLAVSIPYTSVMAAALQQLDRHAQFALHHRIATGLAKHREPLNSLANSMTDAWSNHDDHFGELHDDLNVANNQGLSHDESELASPVASTQRRGLGDVLCDTWETSLSGLEAAGNTIRLNGLYERTHEVLQQTANGWLYDPSVTAGVDPAVVQQITHALLSWSLFFRAIGESIQNSEVLDGERFALGLEIFKEKLATQPGIETAEPTPGSVGAVVAALVDAGLDTLDGDGDFVDIVINSTDAAMTELERGPDENAELAEVGIVHPAAASLLVLMDEFISMVSGEIVATDHDNSTNLSNSARDTTTDLSNSTSETRSPSKTVLPTTTLFELRCHLYPHEGVSVETQAWVESRLWEHVHTIAVTLIDWISTPRLEVALATTELGVVVELVAQIGELREVDIQLADPSHTPQG